MSAVWMATCIVYHIEETRYCGNGYEGWIAWCLLVTAIGYKGRI